MNLISGPHILKVQIEDLQHLYFTSDLHLNHENIIKYAQRPFNSIEEMNDIFISNINETLTEDDILINCGDFILGKNSMYDDYMNNIHCKKIYNCIGNHDMKNIIQRSAFLPYNENERVFWSYNIIIYVYSKNRPIFSFSVSHCPMSDNQFIGLFNIHGHLHTFADIDKYEGSDKELAMKLLDLGTYYDCGVDRNNYKPVTFKNILLSLPKVKEKILSRDANFYNKLYN